MTKDKGNKWLPDMSISCCWSFRKKSNALQHRNVSQITKLLLVTPPNQLKGLTLDSPHTKIQLNDTNLFLFPWRYVPIYGLSALMLLLFLMPCSVLGSIHAKNVLFRSSVHLKYLHWYDAFYSRKHTQNEMNTLNSEKFPILASVVSFYRS